MSNLTEKLLQAIEHLNGIVQDRITEEQQKDPFYQQKIFEKWIKQDEWLLRDQALPLALGLDPDEKDTFIAIEGFTEQAQKAWNSLKALSSEGAGPAVSNLYDPPEKWRVESASYYRWLIETGITVPDALDSLMQFVLNVVKKPVPEMTLPETPDRASVVPGSRSSDREKVLGAALNILSKEPDACRDDSGLTNGRALAEMIAAQSVLWFETAKPPMTVEEMGCLLEKWLE